MKRGPKPTPARIRFMAKIDKQGPIMVGMKTRCWVWTASAVSEDGYGQFCPTRDRHVLAHRFAWELHTGRRVPKKMCILHRCDNPRCVRYGHLFKGTLADNMQDMIAKGRDRFFGRTKQMGG